MLPKNTAAATTARGDRAGDAAAPARSGSTALRRARSPPRARSPRRWRRSRRRAGHQAASSTPSGRLIASVDFGKRRHRHRQLTRSAIAGHGDADLPGARRHHPECAGEQPRGRRSTVTRRRERAQTAAPGPVSGSGTMRISVTSSLVVSTSTSATPGIACGGLIVTKSRYGPAWPSRNTSGLPMCAASGDGGTRTAAQAIERGAQRARPSPPHPLHRAAERASPT